MRAQRAARAAAAEKSSRGGGESRPAGRQTRAGPKITSDVMNGLAKPLSSKREQPLTSPAGVAPGPREAKSGIPKRAAKPLPALKPFGRSDASAAPQERQLGTTPKRGRPRIEDRNKPKPPKPWEIVGMSRRTYFRREAERRQKEAK